MAIHEITREEWEAVLDKRHENEKKVQFNEGVKAAIRALKSAGYKTASDNLCSLFNVEV